MLHQIRLEVSHLCKAYQGTLLSDVSFCMRAGEALCIMGQNSSFKTTLANILCGVTPCDSGTIFVDGKEARISSPYDAHKYGIASLGEISALCEDLSVAENLFLFHSKAGMPVKKWMGKKAVSDYAETFLENYGFGWIDPGKGVDALGLAEKQILAFLCALCANVEFLIVDDAFSALNADELKQIFYIMDDLKKRGIALLYLSSKPELPEIADAFLFIRDGKVKFEASGDELKDLDFSSFALAELPGAYPKLPIKIGDEVFCCAHLAYKSLFRDISFSLREGEILGIVGGAGCGKTTLARMLSGHLQRDHGEICVHGKPVRLSSVHDAYKNGLRLVLDDREYGIIRHLSLADNLIFPYYAQNRARLSLVHPRKYAETSYCLADKLNINYFDIFQSPESLSAGNQQKLVLSRGIVAKSDIFILDEPTRGVDNIGKTQIYNLFNNLLREGKSIVILTSDLNEAAGMCDRTLLLKDGSLTPYRKGAHCVRHQEDWPLRENI